MINDPKNKVKFYTIICLNDIKLKEDKDFFWSFSPIYGSNLYYLKYAYETKIFFGLSQWNPTNNTFDYIVTLDKIVLIVFSKVII